MQKNTAKIESNSDRIELLVKELQAQTAELHEEKDKLKAATDRMNAMIIHISSSVSDLDKKNKNKDSAAFKRGGASATKTS
jgi:hypothetical protein